MSSASDISNLFHILGVSPSNYQEVERTEQLQGSRGRWSTPDEPESPDLTRDNAACETEAVLPADVTEAAAAEPAPQETIEPASAAIAAEAESLPEAEAVQDQPVEQPEVQAAQPAGQEVDQPAAAQSHPEPAAASQQPAALSSVFARLLERNAPQADATPRQVS